MENFFRHLKFRVPEYGLQDLSGRVWRPEYWAYAAVLPTVLFLFEAAKISFYDTARAPNVNLLEQLCIYFVFYGLWISVPRLSWALARRRLERAQATWWSVAFPLSVAGMMLSGLHLFLLTIFLIFMHASAAGVWQLPYLLQAFGEVWLGNFGLWLVTYVILVAIILRGLLGSKDPLPQKTPLARYEVRENGKTLSIPTSDIYWVKAAGNYAELHTARGVMMVRKSLSQVGREVATNGFLKSHRSALVNGHHVLAIRPQSDGTSFLIQLSNDQEAPLSRRNLSAFKELLKNLGER